MLRTHILVLTLLGFFTSKAQRMEIRFLSVYISPTIAGAFHSNNGAPQLLYDSLKRVDTKRFGYLGGVSAYWKIDEFFMIQTSLQYNQTGFKRSLSGLRQHDSIPYVGSITEFSQTGIKEADLVYRFHHIDLPILLHRRIGGSRYLAGDFNNYVFAGFIPQYCFADAYRTHLYGFTMNEKSDFLTRDSKLGVRSMNLSATIGGRFEIEYQDLFLLSLQPSFTASLFAANKSNVSYRPWYIGLNIGLNYSLE